MFRTPNAPPPRNKKRPRSDVGDQVVVVIDDDEMSVDRRTPQSAPALHCQPIGVRADLLTTPRSLRKEQPLPTMGCLKCIECGRVKATEDDLKGHISESHLDYCPHQCAQCKLSFSTVSELKRHFFQAHPGWSLDYFTNCDSSKHAQLNSMLMRSMSADKESATASLQKGSPLSMSFEDFRQTVKTPVKPPPKRSASFQLKFPFRRSQTLASVQPKIITSLPPIESLTKRAPYPTGISAAVTPTVRQEAADSSSENTPPLSATDSIHKSNTADRSQCTKCGRQFKEGRRRQHVLQHLKKDDRAHGGLRQLGKTALFLQALEECFPSTEQLEEIASIPQSSPVASTTAEEPPLQVEQLPPSPPPAPAEPNQVEHSVSDVKRKVKCKKCGKKMAPSYARKHMDKNHSHIDSMAECFPELASEADEPAEESKTASEQLKSNDISSVSKKVEVEAESSSKPSRTSNKKKGRSLKQSILNPTRTMMLVLTRIEVPELSTKNTPMATPSYQASKANRRPKESHVGKDDGMVTIVQPLDEQFMCTECSEMVSTRNMKTHIYIVHIKKKLVFCPHCNFRVIYNLPDVVAHIRTKHPGKLVMPVDKRNDHLDDAERLRAQLFPLAPPLGTVSRKRPLPAENHHWQSGNLSSPVAKSHKRKMTSIVLSEPDEEEQDMMDEASGTTPKSPPSKKSKRDSESTTPASRQRVCVLCNETFSNPTLHIWSKHIGSQRFACPYCSDYTAKTSKPPVMKHVKNVHPDQEQKVDDRRIQLQSKYDNIYYKCFPKNGEKSAEHEATDETADEAQRIIEDVEDADSPVKETKKHMCRLCKQKVEEKGLHAHIEKRHPDNELGDCFSEFVGDDNRLVRHEDPEEDKPASKGLACQLCAMDVSMKNAQDHVEQQHAGDTQDNVSSLLAQCFPDDFPAPQQTVSSPVISSINVAVEESMEMDDLSGSQASKEKIPCRLCAKKRKVPLKDAQNHIQRRHQDAVDQSSVESVLADCFPDHFSLSEKVDINQELSKSESPEQLDEKDTSVVTKNSEGKIPCQLCPKKRLVPLEAAQAHAEKRHGDLIDRTSLDSVLANCFPEQFFASTKTDQNALAGPNDGAVTEESVEVAVEAEKDTSLSEEKVKCKECSRKMKLAHAAVHFTKKHQADGHTLDICFPEYAQRLAAELYAPEMTLNKEVVDSIASIPATDSTDSQVVADSTPIQLSSDGDQRVASPPRQLSKSRPVVKHRRRSTFLISESTQIKIKPKIFKSPATKMVTCKMCSASVRVGGEDRHLFVHVQDKGGPRFTCLANSDCKYKVSLKVEMKKHANEKHGLSASDPTAFRDRKKELSEVLAKVMIRCFGESVGRPHCRICDRAITPNARIHVLKWHLKENIFACPLCDFAHHISRTKVRIHISSNHRGCGAIPVDRTHQYQQLIDEWHRKCFEDSVPLCTDKQSNDGLPTTNEHDPPFNEETTVQVVAIVERLTNVVEVVVDSVNTIANEVDMECSNVSTNGAPSTLNESSTTCTGSMQDAQLAAVADKANVQVASNPMKCREVDFAANLPTDSCLLGDTISVCESGDSKLGHIDSIVANAVHFDNEISSIMSAGDCSDAQENLCEKMEAAEIAVTEDDEFNVITEILDILLDEVCLMDTYYELLQEYWPGGAPPSADFDLKD